MATTKVRYNQIKTGLPAGGDVNYDDVSLLLLMNGANGSTVFTDSSNSNLSNSCLGVNISTAESKFGGSSAYFDGSGDVLKTSSSSNLTLGTGDFTIEFWWRPDDLSTSTDGGWRSIIATNNYFASGSFAVYQQAAGLYVYRGAGSTSSLIMSDTSVFSAGTWANIVWTRSSGTNYLFADGVVAATASDGFDATGDGIWMGANYYNNANSGNGRYFAKGYMDNIRITKGVARYTSNFSVPTAAFPAFESKEGKKMVVGSNGNIDLQ